jgi:L,D-transpeptidase YbiS
MSMAENEFSIRETPGPLRDFMRADRPGRLCYRDRAMLWACRRLGVRFTRFLLVVSVLKQQVRLFEQARQTPGGAHPCYVLRKRFRASTSRRGTGQDEGSNRTPLGLHRIGEKIGAGQPIGTVFESRQPVGLTWQRRPDAPIAHRILWLEGLEPGFNCGGAVDSHARYIYIHGLADEPSLGRPASRGCIHLAASDLMPLFDLLPDGTLVWIAP